MKKLNIYWFDLKFQVHKLFEVFLSWIVLIKAHLIRGVGGLHYHQFSNQISITNSKKIK